MEATRPSDASGTAPNPTRTKPSAHISNTADRTWNQATVKRADRSEQFLYRCFPTHQVLAVQSQCDYLHDCSIINVFMTDLFQFQMLIFLLRRAAFLYVFNESVNCGPSHYADTSSGEVGFLINPTGLWMYTGYYIMKNWVVRTSVWCFFNSEYSSMSGISPPHNWNKGSD
jgi:hypothetical protein